jgi:putative hydrolase of the HAD superfamily
MVSIVLFDIGNVVVLADHGITHRILNEDYGVPLENARNFFNNPSYETFCRGDITGPQFYEVLRDVHLPWKPLTYEQAMTAHDEHLYGVDEKMLAIARDTARRHEIGFLTESNLWQTIKVEGSMVRLKDYSDCIFRSHDLRALKTEPACYEKVLDHLDVEPHEVALVDNNPEKLDVARAAGLIGIEYRPHDPDRYVVLQQDLAGLRRRGRC